MAKRRSLRKIRQHGMSDMLTRYTFETYQTPDKIRERILNAAKKFCGSDVGWFYLAGQSGSGKTHICTAICASMIEQGKETNYMSWRDESRQLKAMVNLPEMDAPMERLKKTTVLYIDDFFKGGMSDADLRLAIEIINARYNDLRLRTVISSEMSLEQILAKDESLGGKIYERSKGYVLQAPSENWRLKS